VIRLIIADDGVGFSPEDVPPDRFGLLGMRERLTLIDGSLTVDSRPGQGAIITAEIPC